ncbi:MAG: hypothetical protein JAZ12_15405 [Candidatus Thiodiazotropha taylori]|nr:hypothetical protein [Candidatus Thiodiazotropha taylori]
MKTNDLMQPVLAYKNFLESSRKQSNTHNALLTKFEQLFKNCLLISSDELYRSPLTENGVPIEFSLTEDSNENLSLRCVCDTSIPTRDIQKLKTSYLNFGKIFLPKASYLDDIEAHFLRHFSKLPDSLETLMLFGYGITEKGAETYKIYFYVPWQTTLLALNNIGEINCLKNKQLVQKYTDKRNGILFFGYDIDSIGIRKIKSYINISNLDNIKRDALIEALGLNIPNNLLHGSYAMDNCKQEWKSILSLSLYDRDGAPDTSYHVNLGFLRNKKGLDGAVNLISGPTFSLSSKTTKCLEAIELESANLEYIPTVASFGFRRNLRMTSLYFMPKNLKQIQKL